LFFGANYKLVCQNNKNNYFIQTMAKNLCWKDLKEQQLADVLNGNTPEEVKAYVE